MKPEFWKRVVAGWTQKLDTERKRHLEDLAAQVVESSRSARELHQTDKQIPSALDAILFGKDDDDEFF